MPRRLRLPIGFLTLSGRRPHSSSRPLRFIAPLIFRKAATGSTKNITPNRAGAKIQGLKREVMCFRVVQHKLRLMDAGSSDTLAAVPTVVQRYQRPARDRSARPLGQPENGRTGPAADIQGALPRFGAQPVQPLSLRP